MAYENNECGSFLRRERTGWNVLCHCNGTHVVVVNGQPLTKQHWDAAQRGPQTDKPWLMCLSHANRAARRYRGAAVQPA